jgi:hypothetical protein
MHVLELEPLVVTCIPFQNGVTLVCVSSATFILNCWRLMDSPHFCITNVHAIIVEYFYFTNTLPSPILVDLVFPFRWLEKGIYWDVP